MKRIFLLLGILTSLVAFGQDPCDDLLITSVQYSPFTDTVIVVQVENNSSSGFQYPGFVLISTNGDTVAKEQVDLFGIGQESVS